MTKSKSIGRRALVLVSAVLLTLAAVVGVANASGNIAVKFELKSDKSSSSFLTQLKAINTHTGQLESPFTTPPLNGCDWSDVKGNVTGYYSPQRILLNTEAFYSSSVICTPTGADQTMDYLSDIAKLFLDGTEEDEGNLAQCDYPAVNPCNAIGSVGHFLCAGELPCSGSYRVYHYADMLLPEGWAWQTPTPIGCQDLDPREMYCNWYSQPAVIPAILP